MKERTLKRHRSVKKQSNNVPEYKKIMNPDQNKLFREMLHSMLEEFRKMFLSSLTHYTCTFFDIYCLYNTSSIVGD